MKQVSTGFFPSLRIGYLIIPSDLVSAFSRIRQASDLSHSTNAKPSAWRGAAFDRPKSNARL
jgi:DNA-binding transcriptional MocR family regulator